MQIQKKESGLVGLDSSQSACLLQFTKVLAERLKKVMSCVISPYQCAFIEGRQILDSILIANEVMEYRSKKKKGWILKLGLEKPSIVLIGTFLRKF